MGLSGGFVFLSVALCYKFVKEKYFYDLAENARSRLSQNIGFFGEVVTLMQTIRLTFHYRTVF